MPSSRSCIVREVNTEREYRVAPPERWDMGVPSSQAARRRPNKPRRRKPSLFPLFLLGLALFSGGFLLGQALADDDVPTDTAAISSSQNDGAQGVSNQDEGGQAPVQAFHVIGAVTGGSSGGTMPGIQTEDWRLRLVNADNLLPEDFAVPELTQLKNGHAIDSRAYPELQAMMDAARNAGYQPLICSSYRTWEKQAELFQNKTNSYIAQGSSQEQAEEQAAYWVARPGTSEHQLGLALDIVDKEYQLLDQAQEDRPVQQWLMAHCAEYGFILRYPTAKSSLTGVGYEPWHYRYVGKDAAREIMSAGICLEEYLSASLE